MRTNTRSTKDHAMRADAVSPENRRRLIQEGRWMGRGCVFSSGRDCDRRKLKADTRRRLAEEAC